MVFSALFHPKFKLTIADAQRSAIAGGVAMSSNANLLCEPWLALVIGTLGGMACCFGIHQARGFFEKRAWHALFSIHISRSRAAASTGSEREREREGGREGGREGEREREREL